MAVPAIASSFRSERVERGRAAWIALACLLALPLVTTRIYASDEVQYFAWLRSIAFDRDVDFENEYRFFYDNGLVRTPDFHQTFLERTNEANRRINFAPVGCAILWAPFYGAGHVAALVTGARADGLSRPYIAAVAYGSSVYGVLAVMLSADIARRLVGRGAGSSLAIWIGTPLVFYTFVTPVFSHATSAFAVALFIWLWLRVRERWSVGGTVALAAAGALMAMVREQDLFFVLGPAIDFIVAVAGRTFRSAIPAGLETRPAAAAWGLGSALFRAVAAVGAFVLAFSPQLLAYNALNGHPGPTDLVTRKMTWTSPHALQVLFSPEHGLFAWTPMALLAIAGMVALAAGRRDGDARLIGALCLVMIALQVYVTGAVESWTLAGSFGQRRFVSLTPLLTIGLAMLFGMTVARLLFRVLLVSVVILCLWWNLGLMAQFGMHLMDRQRLDLPHNARMTFVVLPRAAPAIVWRYLTDRSSFYRVPPLVLRTDELR